ncbi:uncharacterized protein LOC113549488 [Rhopalosiphum maidis]|uniref:uncharacterized protein LOC113549488 n=1 Tax=Rhopalosiphum maidis TaxID=43146 RepID=UPI000EFE69D4|nr:uncharacterized protein LOC113549488 [Rhopalosiphum maidis]
MLSSDDIKCSLCQNKNKMKCNNSKKQQQTSSFVANYDYSMASTSTVQYERPPSPEDTSCTHIRNMTFLKNSYKNVPAPSKQFLRGVNCAVIKLLKEIEENHKLCIKKSPNRQASKRRQHKS